MAGSIQQRLSELRWESPGSFTLDGVRFDLEDMNAPRDGDGYKVMKPITLLEAYAAALKDAPAENVLELGIHKGGSTALFAVLLQPRKIVSIDISGPAKALERFRREHPLGARISPRYNTSQADAEALGRILAEEFDDPLDLVIDDASHDYDLTRASFETLFPRLRPFGWYVIEDWSWAHVHPLKMWPDRPALSNLAFQLTMVCASQPELIDSIEIRPGVAFVRKGSCAPSTSRLDLDRSYWAGDRTLKLL